MPETTRQHLWFAEAQKELDCSYSKLKRMIADGQLPKPCKIGKRPCFKRDDFFLAIEKMLNPDQAMQPI